ncbi:N-6 DNA methylase [candidate division TM7 genomosp. GTL1]|nr:N-6 DNA methylase [candidate division TM7 genomosp. GTL1]
MLREDRLEVRLIGMLEAIKDPKKKLLAKLQAALQIDQPQSIVGKHRDQVIKSLNRQLKRLQDMDDTLYEDKLANYISAERYEQKRQELVAQILEVQSRLAKLYEVQGEQKEEKTEPLSKYPIVNLYLQSSPSQKGTIMAQIYKSIWADGDKVDFRTTTSNKQLNFVQHICSQLKVDGKAAVIVPDNVLFEGGAGETIRKKLLQTTEIHTILRLPTGIFYANGVKANVIFFDNRPASKEVQTKDVWVYDMRTNQHFTLKEKKLANADLADFIKCYNPDNRHQRSETERFKKFTYDEVVTRDKTNLDIFWLKDESITRMLFNCLRTIRPVLN